MFVLSKLLPIAAMPGNFLLLVLALGTLLLWTRVRRAGRWLVSGAVVCLLFISVFQVGNWLLVPLEDRFPPVDPPTKVDGIVVLGGEVNPPISEARGRPTLKGSAERMTAFVALARRYPNAKLVFTGGSASLAHPEWKEAPYARSFFAQQGLDISRVRFEDRSRNTYENALYTKVLMRPKPGETWLMITSANHMPRAVGCFSRVGWKVVPYPVDYLTTGRYDFTPGFYMSGGLGRFELAFHEWVGLVAYRIVGYTDALFPGPKTAPTGNAD